MKPQSYRPVLESLEDRMVPTVQTVSGLLPAPSDLTATVVNGQVNLTWADHSWNEMGYIIERISHNGWVTQIGQVGPGITTFTDTNIHGKKDYWYRIYAFNDTDISMDAEVSQWVHIIPGKKR